MKNNNFIFSPRRLFLFVLSLFVFSLTTTYAQIGPSPNATNTPNFGIYGGAPTPASTPFPCGTPRYAKLELYPDPAQGEGLTTWSQTLPLNGIKNFNFYYTPDGTGFLSGGGYRVTYLNANQTNCYGFMGDIVTYSPNRAHTNGVQVRPFLGSVTTPRGIHGVILARIPGGGGATTYLENAIASVGPANLYKAKTNGLGYFSIYYSNNGPDGFLPYSSAYYTHISGFSNGCPYEWDDPLGSIWILFGGPDDPGYYNNESDIGTITLSSSSTSPACRP